MYKEAWTRFYDSVKCIFLTRASETRIKFSTKRGKYIKYQIQLYAIVSNHKEGIKIHILVNRENFIIEEN